MHPILAVLIVLTALAILVLAGVGAYRAWQHWHRIQWKRSYMRQFAPPGRDGAAVANMQAETIRACVDSLHLQEPIVFSMVKTRTGHGGIAVSHYAGWQPKDKNYAQGPGAEILHALSEALAQMERTGHANTISTLQVMLDQRRDELKEEPQKHLQ